MGRRRRFLCHFLITKNTLSNMPTKTGSEMWLIAYIGHCLITLFQNYGFFSRKLCYLCWHQEKSNEFASNERIRWIDMKTQRASFIAFQRNDSAHVSIWYSGTKYMSLSVMQMNMHIGYELFETHSALTISCLLI